MTNYTSSHELHPTQYVTIYVKGRANVRLAMTSDATLSANVNEQASYGQLDLDYHFTEGASTSAFSQKVVAEECGTSGPGGISIAQYPGVSYYFVHQVQAHAYTRTPGGGTSALARGVVSITAKRAATPPVAIISEPEELRTAKVGTAIA